MSKCNVISNLYFQLMKYNERMILKDWAVVPHIWTGLQFLGKWITDTLCYWWTFICNFSSRQSSVLVPTLLLNPLILGNILISIASSALCASPLIHQLSLYCTSCSVSTNSQTESCDMKWKQRGVDCHLLGIILCGLPGATGPCAGRQKGSGKPDISI